jgi:hypothetical protein
MKIIHQYEGYTYSSYGIDVGRKDYYFGYMINLLENYTRFYKFYEGKIINERKINIVLPLNKNNIPATIEKFYKLAVLI